jgi:hypothetical protein
MTRPTRSFGPLAAALLAFLPGAGPHAQGFQSTSGATRTPPAAVPTPAAPTEGQSFQSVGTPGAPVVAAPPVTADESAGEPAVEPFTAPPPAPAMAVPSVPAEVPVTAPLIETVPPPFTSRPAPVVASAGPAPVASTPAATALAFSSVSAPNGGRSASAGGAGPMLPAPDGSAPSFELADRIVIEKGVRRLYLLRGDDVIVEYPVKLGLNPYGHKQREGDFRTPEGTYHLSRRNPRSEFFLSLEVSYPNEFDRARARQAGVRPGGLIMIHGQPNVPRKAPDYYANNDWTDGCIAVSNSDMVEIWQRTRLGIPIEIRP